ncbi:hypothetical protein HRI_001390300 [Hibiscus trionum]|uniref:VQ domain-containing protein n=1 Tax=Hibiscus trionum TaxID=183268 RepID=A0A9W7LW23_HIBTR|nr:hypothetical protein HRI_001390300 [Hibiscus trionum]
MDSGNSSSLQSSSGDDEEYCPAFLNPSGHFSALSHHQPPTFFVPSPSYLNNPFSQSQLLHLDGVRPRSLRSDPNCTDLLLGSSSSSQSILGPQGLNPGSFPRSSSVQTRPPHDNNGVRSSTKNPKKRTRASRTAPTTVLTTDTTNFRAMVQEFTGIPAPPFPATSSYSRRLDLFGSGSGLGSLYPLRPSAKRVQLTPFVSSSSSPPLLNSPLVDAAINTSTNPSNYQLPWQPRNMLYLQKQSPILPFQSFLHPPPLHPSVNMHGLGELGLSHSQVNANLGGLAPDVARHGNGRDGVVLNQDHLRALDWNYGNTSDSHEKALENVSSRAEWICPSE